MTPGTYNLNFYRGDSYSYRFILWKDELKTNPVDLTDATVKSEIRDKPAGTAILPLPCTVTLPNMVDVVMTPDMYDNCPSKGVWDLQITFVDGEVQTPIAGSVTVTLDVTDSTDAVSTLGKARRG